MLAAVIAVSLISCKRTGCTDPVALTYDEKAKESDQSECRYTTVVFYASSNTHTGDEVEKIEITIGQEHQLIGTIKSLNQAYPSSCDAAGTLKYTFTSSVGTTWSARYFYVDGGESSELGQIEPSNGTECLRVDVLP